MLLLVTAPKEVIVNLTNIYMPFLNDMDLNMMI